MFLLSLVVCFCHHFGKLAFIAWGYNKLEALQPHDANSLALGTEVVDPGPGVLDYSATFMLTRCCQAPHGFIWLYMALYGFIWLYMALYGFNML